MRAQGSGDQVGAKAADFVEMLKRAAAAEMGSARALPMNMYTSSELFELEKVQIFRKEWICVGRLEQVKKKGDYFTVEILGEPIIVVRGQDEKVRAMSAVCRHARPRSKPLRINGPCFEWTPFSRASLLFTSPLRIR